MSIFFFVGMIYNWSFHHPDPIEGEEGGILLLRYSMINVYGLTFYILMMSCEDRSPSLLPPSGIMLIEHPPVSNSYGNKVFTILTTAIPSKLVFR